MSNRFRPGCTAVCVASGPSLTAEDCALVGQSGLPVIAVNTSWRLARFADVLFAGDAAWWNHYGAEVDIPAQRWTASQQAARRHELNLLPRALGARNSGLRAIDLAVHLGARRVVLLGYDCRVGERTHWHGDHAQTSNPDLVKCRSWVRDFSLQSQQLERDGVEVINCSRDTALWCFSRMDLSACLAGELPHAA